MTRQPQGPQAETAGGATPVEVTQTSIRYRASGLTFKTDIDGMTVAGT